MKRTCICGGRKSNVLAEDYQKNKKPSNEFIVEFADKYKLEIPFDLYFDDSALFCED